jgi:DNA-directed RNA polymerase subunit RPC12/RpoP
MEQRPPSALPLECPTCGSRTITATGVTASGQQRILDYRCLSCGATWRHTHLGGEDLFHPPPTLPGPESESV